MPLTYTYPEIADIPQEAVEDPEQLTQHLNALVDMIRKLRDETATQTITQVADDAAAYQLLSGKGVAGGYAGLITGPYLENHLPLLHVRDEKAANTSGGTFTNGAWRTRTLNTETTNEIADASLSSNQITLPAGTYWIEARAEGHAVARHKLKLYDTTNTTDIILGVSADSGNAGPSLVIGRFTLAGVVVLELQHRCTTTRASDGLGRESNYAVIEVYADVRIWKVA